MSSVIVMINTVRVNCLQWYGKCPKISYTKVANKMAYANSADPHQTVPEGGLIRVYTVCLFNKYFRNNFRKAKFWAKKVWNKVFEILGH